MSRQIVQIGQIVNDGEIVGCMCERPIDISELLEKNFDWNILCKRHRVTALEICKNNTQYRAKQIKGDRTKWSRSKSQSRIKKNYKTERLNKISN